MALCHIPRRVKVPQLLHEARRHTGALSRACAALPDVLLDPKSSKRSRSVHKESAPLALMPYVFNEASVTGYPGVGKKDEDIAYSYREPSPVSVMNLKALLEALPSAQDRSLLFSYLNKSQKSVIQQYFDGAVPLGAFSNSHEQIALDGQFLDRVFNIGEKDSLNDDSSQSESVHSAKLQIKDNDSFPEFSETIFDEFHYRNGDRPVSLGSDIALVLGNLSREERTSEYCGEELSLSDNLVWSDPSEEMYISELCQDSFVFFSSSGANLAGTPSGGDQKRANLDQLHSIQDYLNDYLPKCFSKRHNYKIYSEHMLFENNFAEKPYHTLGKNAYGREMAKFRIYAHLRYANVRMQVLKSTVQEEAGTVTVRWRVAGIPQAQAFMFWKFLPWNYKKSMGNEAEWLDGISTFYVQGEEGLIYKHRVDRVIPDEDVAPDVVKPNNLNVSGAV